MTEALTFPDPERTFYLRLGGVLHLLLGVGLLVVGHFASGWIWTFCGGILSAVGFLATGFVYETVFDPQRGIVSTRRGLYFLRRRQQYPFTDFQRVEVRKRVKMGHRFSNLSDKTYDQVTQTSYEVILVGDRQELRVESTQYQDKANNWAKKVGDVVRVEVG